MLCCCHVMYFADLLSVSHVVLSFGVLCSAVVLWLSFALLLHAPPTLVLPPLAPLLLSLSSCPQAPLTPFCSYTTLTLLLLSRSSCSPYSRSPPSRSHTQSSYAHVHTHTHSLTYLRHSLPPSTCSHLLTHSATNSLTHSLTY